MKGRTPVHGRFERKRYQTPAEQVAVISPYRSAVQLILARRHE
jgi:hypothetical protein